MKEILRRLADEGITVMFGQQSGAAVDQQAAGRRERARMRRAHQARHITGGRIVRAEGKHLRRLTET